MNLIRKILQSKKPQKHIIESLIVCIYYVKIYYNLVYKTLLQLIKLLFLGDTYPYHSQRAPLAPLKQPNPTGERTEFRMHGMKGPHSYQFGYDTGKG